MFLFGETGDTARLYLESIIGSDPRSFPDAPVDELSLQELENALVWLNIAVSQSVKTLDDASVRETLIEWYDEVFEAHTSASDKLLKAIKDNRHLPPTGRRDLPKYVAIAERASES